MHKIWLALAGGAACAWFLCGSPGAQAVEAPMVTPQDHILGKPEAPLTIIEYGSLTCPHCAEFDRVTLPKIKAAWIDTGKAKLIFRDFPLDQAALKAAMVAQCAPPERYYAFIDTLYQSQSTWATRSSNLKAALGGIAKLGGLTDEQFSKCIEDPQLQQSITGAEVTAQNSYGVESTPTFFINGVKMDPNGAQPFEVFDRLLTAAMPKS
jgi:protein-disulfide isomerase